MANPSTPVPTPRDQRLADFRHRTLPLVVWFVAAALVAGLLISRGRQYEYLGLANSLQYEISAAADGTVETVVVDLYDSVSAGDVVAKMDDSRLLARIEASSARVAQLQAELAARRIEILTGRGSRPSDRSADLRRFQIDEEERRLEILGLRVRIESDEIDVERLRLASRRARQLLDAGLIGEQEYDDERLAYESARKALDENRILLSQLEEELGSAQRRTRSFEAELATAPDIDTLLQPLRAEIAVEQAAVREIELARESTLLRSPVEGQVSEILCRSGQAVRPGEPILTIAEQRVSEIVAYRREDDTRTIALNSPVLVASRSRPGVLAESIVVRVGRAVTVLPQRLWRDPRVPDYGRALVIAASPSMDLVPGELVGVKVLGDPE